MKTQNDASIGFATSAFFHLAALLFGSALWVQSAQYGVEVGVGGVEFELSGGSAASIQEESPSVLPVSTPEGEEVLKKNEVEEKTLSVAAEPPSIASLGGDGGAVSEAKPGYLKNKAPVYPEAARRSGQQGLVLLRIDVSDRGDVLQVMIEKSSGYELLDTSALRAVRRWKFEPAKLGGVRVAAEVRVPIRFEIR